MYNIGYRSRGFGVISGIRISANYVGIVVSEEFVNIIVVTKFFKTTGSGGIRTHAFEETGALNQRLRALGHATI